MILCRLRICRFNGRHTKIAWMFTCIAWAW